MVAFSISETALKEILHIFHASKYRKPVARLYERANADLLFSEVDESLLQGNKNSEELIAIAKKRFDEVEDQLESSLAIGVHEDIEFRTEDLSTVNGITFVMGPDVPELLCNCCLTFENGCFFLRDQNNVAHTLRSLARQRRSHSSD
jgi:hypothetical protein